MTCLELNNQNYKILPKKYSEHRKYTYLCKPGMWEGTPPLGYKPDNAPYWGFRGKDIQEVEWIAGADADGLMCLRKRIYVSVAEAQRHTADLNHIACIERMWESRLTLYYVGLEPLEGLAMDIDGFLNNFERVVNILKKHEDSPGGRLAVGLGMGLVSADDLMEFAQKLQVIGDILEAYNAEFDLINRIRNVGYVFEAEAVKLVSGDVRTPEQFQETYVILERMYNALDEIHGLLKKRDEESLCVWGWNGPPLWRRRELENSLGNFLYLRIGEPPTWMYWKNFDIMGLFSETHPWNVKEPPIPETHDAYHIRACEKIREKEWRRLTALELIDFLVNKLITSDILVDGNIVNEIREAEVRLRELQAGRENIQLVIKARKYAALASRYIDANVVNISRLSLMTVWQNLVDAWGLKHKYQLS